MMACLRFSKPNTLLATGEIGIIKMCRKGQKEFVASY
jgi:hypothetical protein